MTNNSPIQVVLNPSDFIELWERQGGGLKKDFYSDNDVAFVAHKKNLAGQLSHLKQKQIENEFSDISYAKLVLKQSALAKSHRPTASIFTKEIAPVVGAGDLGELFIELRPSSIDKINAKIQTAEEETRWKKGINGKENPHPSAVRSEVGAIEEIKPYLPSDKRKFSTSEGLAWICDPRTGGAYIVELFETPPPIRDWNNLPNDKLKLFKSFVDGLTNLGNGLIVSRLVDSDPKTSMLGVRLEDSSAPPAIQLLPSAMPKKRQGTAKKIILDVDKHAILLEFLDAHPLVKKIILPPIITKSDASDARQVGTKFTLPSKNAQKSYPKVGIIDGGVSDVLNDWIVDRWGFLSPDDKDEDHGTFIGGLVLAGNAINGPDICKDLDGCEIIDLDLLPKAEYFANYYTKPLEFFRELEMAVKDLKERTGVRIFNFSLNIEEHVSTDGYSPAAKMLDKIAEENDVIFTISAGNTDIRDLRKEWPNDPVEALSILAASRNDKLKTPAESSRNLCISALNPPNMAGIVPYAPSNYTCRGPGMRVGVKPDLAHVGGCGTKVSGCGHGLLSVNPLGEIVDGCGTSYAAPNVAKTLACLENEIEGEVSRESLIALAIHHASLPNVLADKKLNDVAKHLAGFGIPGSAEDILAGNEHSITLVFATRIYQGRKMSFNFTWPPSLVKNGKCLGKVRLTVISTPPFNYRYGSEFVRINVDGHLRQQDKNGKYKGRLNAVYVPEEFHKHEKDMIDHTFKWSPVKVSENTFKRGIGPSTDWKLEIEYLARDGESLPTQGVPFTAILTISDLDEKKPVFNEMRQSLNALGVQILDIKTAARVAPRV